VKDDLPDEVSWDVDRVNEVLGNLLSNAFKFTPRGGRVTLTVEPEGDTVAMSVTDTGAGIPPAQLPRIFEKFYQADNQRSAAALFSAADSALAAFALAYPGTPEAAETAYWRAVFALDPSAATASLAGPMSLLDGYLRGGPPRAHLAEAASLRRVAAQLDALS